MKKVDKLYNILDQLTINPNNNYKIIDKNIKFLVSISNDKNFFIYLSDYKHDDKLVYFLMCIQINLEYQYYFKTALLNSLKIKKDGNNIFHLFAERKRGAQLILLMLKLYDKISDSKLADDILYQYNNDNETFMKVLFNYFEKYPNYKHEKFDDLLMYLITNGYSDVIRYKMDKDGSTILEMIDKIDNKILSEYDKQNIKINFWDKKFYNFLMSLTDDKEENIKLINNAYISVNYKDIEGTLLHRCANCYNEHDIDSTEYFIRLLEVGVDPNVLNKDNRNFIENIILRKPGSEDVIYLLLKECIKYDYNYNTENNYNILMRFLSKFRAGKISFNLFKLLCDNGFDVYENVNNNILLDHCPIILEEKDIYKYFLDLYSLHRFIDSLNAYLKIYYNIKFEEDFKLKFKEVREEFDFFKKLIFAAHNEDFSNIVMITAQEIINNRENSIKEISGDVSIIELMDAFRSLFLQTDKTFNDMCDRCSQKVLNK